MDPVVTPHPSVIALAQTAEERRTAYRHLFEADLGGEALDRIRRSTNSGFALGNQRFEQDISDVLKRPVVPAKRGRPKSDKQPE